MSRLCGLVERNFMQGAEVLMEVPGLASGAYLLEFNLMEVPLELIKSQIHILVLQVHSKYQP